MNIKGKVIVLGELREGQSQNGQWQRREVVVETLTDYPKKVAVEFGKPELLDGVKVGDIIDCLISPDSKEYNGKWYTQIRGIGLKILGTKEAE